MSTVRAMAEQAIEGDPEGAALGTPIDMANPPQAIHSESALEEPQDEEQLR